MIGQEFRVRCGWDGLGGVEQTPSAADIARP